MRRIARLSGCRSSTLPSGRLSGPAMHSYRTGSMAGFLKVCTTVVALSLPGGNLARQLHKRIEGRGITQTVGVDDQRHIRATQ